MPYEILTRDQMAQADRLAIQDGIPGFTLMKKAGGGVTAEIRKRFKPGRVTVLCGPGHNGGDGFVAAAGLKKAGWNVRVACLSEKKSLKGDAGQAAALWKGKIESFAGLKIPPGDLVVDAVFGTGFSGNLKKPVPELFRQMAQQKNPVVAVDIPSGVNASTGAADKDALPALFTVTFARKKLGHVLEPGKSCAGQVLVCDIGITDHAIAKAGHAALENNPGLWREYFPVRTGFSHKYAHGHALVFGADKMTGATRLAAEACARMGAGLTTVVAPGKSADIYRSTLPAHIIVEDFSGEAPVHLEDKRRSAILIGPGAGRDTKSVLKIIEAATAKHRKKMVLDADALNALAGQKITALQNCIMTPHEGEFERLFPDLKGNKVDRAKAAAKKAGCVIVLKGGDTVITDPDGLCVVNTNAPPCLATGGTGDVLAGMIAGLLAQGMKPFWAACAAVWIHGEAANLLGPGLVAGDLIVKMPLVLNHLGKIYC